ncbi:ferredoxin [Jannaschia sp. Os4]|uniref:ferredoxin n=1 Tax=Jannaschia sp. Os4 TaxID=2807617 RepID=UPI0031B64CA3
MADAAVGATYDDLAAHAPGLGLTVLGALHEDGTVVLLGPDPDRFWPILTAAPEWGAPDPVDRWSARVIGAWATEIGATARFPFGGPPWEPFLRWATASGRCHPSPVGPLVHDALGLMVSFRGALHLPRRIAIPAPSPSPCRGCTAPCTTACPVGALSDAHPYDVPACHAFLDTPAGEACLSGGCLVRRACPASPARPAAQSAHHMAHFHQVERQ